MALAKSRDKLELRVDDRDLKRLFGSFSKMDEIAKEDIKRVASQIADKNAKAIVSAAQSAPNPRQATAVVSTLQTVSTSKEPTLKLYRKNKVTSGGTEAGYLFPGSNFGSNNYKQFPPRAPRVGRGNLGYWLYNTLSKRQPEMLKEWLDSYKLIRDAWTGRI